MATQGRYLPDWTIGTLTLEADTLDFTTTDSLLVTAEIQPGDTIITASGLTLPIAEITGENAGKLAYPCPAAAAGVDQPLRIRYQSESSRYTGMAATLFKMLRGGNLYSLGELQGTEGDYLRFLAPGVLEAVAGGNLDAIRELEQTGNLVALATLGARQIIQTDATGALKSIALTANKLLNTDANGDVFLSAITAYGRSIVASANASALRTVSGSDRPAFAAYPPADISIGNGVNAVNMTATNVNVGNHWNGYRFLCPEAGNYLFSLSTQWNGGQDNTGYGILRIKKNGTTAIGGVENKGLWFKHVTITSLIPLAVGDTVTFEFELTNAAGILVLQASNTRAHCVLMR